LNFCKRCHSLCHDMASRLIVEFNPK
jgi:hypothetical protein